MRLITEQTHREMPSVTQAHEGCLKILLNHCAINTYMDLNIRWKESTNQKHNQE